VKWGRLAACAPVCNRRCRSYLNRAGKMPAAGCKPAPQELEEQANTELQFARQIRLVVQLAEVADRIAFAVDAKELGVRIGEIRGVEGIQSLGAELSLEAFLDRDRLEQ